MTRFMIIGIGGFIGAILRYSVSLWIHSAGKMHITAGTFAVNFVGCLALGFVTGITEHMNISEHLRLFVSVGLLGALTTFSTFSVETLNLMRKGASTEAFIYITASIILGLLAAFIGYKTGLGLK